MLEGSRQFAATAEQVHPGPVGSPFGADIIHPHAGQVSLEPVEAGIQSHQQQRVLALQAQPFAVHINRLGPGHGGTAARAGFEG